MEIYILTKNSISYPIKYYTTQFLKNSHITRKSSKNTPSLKGYFYFFTLFINMNMFNHDIDLYK